MREVEVDGEPFETYDEVAEKMESLEGLAHAVSGYLLSFHNPGFSKQHDGLLVDLRVASHQYEERYNTLKELKDAT